MGTERNQPLTLICNYPNAKLYTLDVDLSGLKLLNVDVGLEWGAAGSFQSRENGIYKRVSDLSTFCRL